MQPSTAPSIRALIRPALSMFLLTACLICSATAALAARPRLGVAPLAYEVPNVRAGLAQLLTRELTYGGRFDLVDAQRMQELLEAEEIGPAGYMSLDLAELEPLAGEVDYVLLGKVTALDVADKDSGVTLSGAMKDLGVAVGLGKQIAQIVVDFRLVKTADGSEVMRFTAEGLESRHGLKLEHLSYGYLGSVAFASDEFRQTSLGRATYKLAGQVMRRLYDRYPLSGKVLAVQGDSLVLDLDERSGLEVGDELLITQPLPVTSSDGTVVWVDEQRVGGVKVLRFQPGRALCLILDGDELIEEVDTAYAVIERLSLPKEAEEE